MATVFGSIVADALTAKSVNADNVTINNQLTAVVKPTEFANYSSLVVALNASLNPGVIVQTANPRTPWYSDGTNWEPLLTSIWNAYARSDLNVGGSIVGGYTDVNDPTNAENYLEHIPGVANNNAKFTNIGWSAYHTSNNAIGFTGSGGFTISLEDEDQYTISISVSSKFSKTGSPAGLTSTGAVFFAVGLFSGATLQSVQYLDKAERQHADFNNTSGSDWNFTLQGSVPLTSGTYRLVAFHNFATGDDPTAASHLDLDITQLAITFERSE